MTVPSAAFAASLMSWILAEEITADRGIPFLSVRMGLFGPSFTSVCGIVSGHRPPKGDFMDMLSMDCHVQLIPITPSYDFNNLTHVFLKTSSLFHSWNLL